MNFRKRMWDSNLSLAESSLPACVEQITFTGRNAFDFVAETTVAYITRRRPSPAITDFFWGRRVQIPPGFWGGSRQMNTRKELRKLLFSNLFCVTLLGLVAMNILSRFDK